MEAKNYSRSENNILEYGKNFLQSQADAINKTAAFIDVSFAKAVLAITNKPNYARVIVSGLGKAGYCGQKLSSTLSSVGIASFFVHASEASHGDFGRFSPHDIIILFSHSGETSEVCEVLVFVKSLNCTTISITSNLESSLARGSDINICYGSIAEAGPLGVAPTTSTSIMLALGDALSMASANLKNLTDSKYASLHPGGTLGRKLMTIENIMRVGERNCVVNNTLTVLEVVNAYSQTKDRIGAATIVNAQGELAGVFTDGNLRRLVSTRPEALNESISQHMTRNPLTIQSGAKAIEGLNKLSSRKIDQLVVVDSANRPVGMIDIQDLIQLIPI
jgi:arabinose-5-phosphate isomerase